MGRGRAGEAGEVVRNEEGERGLRFTSGIAGL